MNGPAPTSHTTTPHSGDGCNLVWTDVSDLSIPKALLQGFMLERLHQVEELIPNLLLDVDSWRTLDIDHCIPRVERLFRKVGELWISLHVIGPCEREEALLHPHPWPSAMRIVSGKYEMGVGYGKGREIPPLAAVVVLPAGAEYEMSDPDGWHYVRPIGGPSMSLMVTGEKWDRSAPKNSQALKELSSERKGEILEAFMAAYPIKS